MWTVGIDSVSSDNHKTLRGLGQNPEDPDDLCLPRGYVSGLAHHFNHALLFFETSSFNSLVLRV